MNFLKKLLTNTGPKPFFERKFLIDKFLIGKNFSYLNKDASKNKNKIFYVIKRTPGAGLFSNVTFVINHLRICDKFKFIPIIDMENFTTIYNEKEKINNTYNSWEYYFEKINKYSLSEVYKSQNVILTSSFFQQNMSVDIEDKKYLIYLKKIKIKKKYFIKVNKFFKNYFLKNDKILGVHFRGSTYKTARGHAYPSTTEEMIKNIKKLLKKYNYNKIFLSTEEEKYLHILKKQFGDKLINYNSYRMKNLDSFKIYPRRFHRFKLGEESLIEALILSKCDGITYIKSNLTSYAKILSKKKQEDHEIFFGYNSRNKYIARWKWYLKLYFPIFFGRIKIEKKIKSNY